MTAPLTPGPDDSRALSSREREILAGIEHDLIDAEPRLQTAMARGRPGADAVTPLRLVVLLVILTVLCAVAAVLPDAGTLLLPLLTVGTVAPWVLWCLR